MTWRTIYVRPYGTVTVFDPRKPPTVLDAAVPLCRIAGGVTSVSRVSGRCFHSSTSQLKLSIFCQSSHPTYPTTIAHVNPKPG
jgi:hypothetical protein